MWHVAFSMMITLHLVLRLHCFVWDFAYSHSSSLQMKLFAAANNHFCMVAQGFCLARQRPLPLFVFSPFMVRGVRGVFSLASVVYALPWAAAEFSASRSLRGGEVSCSGEGILGGLKPSEEMALSAPICYGGQLLAESFTIKVGT